MIFTAATQFDDIDEKDILDLGCGCAVLSIASVMMGAECVPPSLSSSSSTRFRSLGRSFADKAPSSPCSSVTSVDVDPEALAIAKENVESVEMDEHIDFVRAEIGPPGAAPTNEAGVPVLDPASLGKKFDTVVMKCVDRSPLVPAAVALADALLAQPSFRLVAQRHRHGLLGDSLPGASHLNLVNSSLLPN